MNEYAVLAVAIIASLAGAALGARLAGAVIWKAVAAILVATIVQFTIGEFVNIENWMVSSLVFLAAFGLVGGRWGFKMSARQMAVIVIGSFLFAIVGGVVAILLFPNQPV